MFKIKRYITIFLALIICFSMFGCARKNADAASYKINGDEVPLKISDKADNKELYFDNLPVKQLTQLSGSDMAALFFNEKQNSVTVYDRGSGKLWRGLPEKYTNEKTGTLALNIIADGCEYTLFSQSDSTATAELKENGVTVTYAFSAETEKGTKLEFTLPVDFIGKDGTLTAKINCANIVNLGKNKKAVLRSVSILPFFGSFSGGDKNSYLVIPDGSGAKVAPTASGENERVYTVEVYGTTGATAVVPAFGIKQGDSALAAVISQGAAISSVKAHTGAKSYGCNRAYAEFEITPTEKDEKGNYYISENNYKGNIEVSYRFLSKDSADYAGIAGACRELLVRSGELRDTNYGSKAEYPFNLSLIAVKNTMNEKGKSEQQVLSGFSQCYAILENLKAKDINNINLRYKGIFEGGILQQSITSAKISQSLGSKAELKELTDFALKSNIRIFPDICLVSSAFEKQAAVSLGSGVNSYEKNGLRFELSAVSNIHGNTKTMLTKMRESDFDGICLSDAGSVLYADFAQNAVNLKTDTAEIIGGQMGAVSASVQLMVEKGNLYSVKYASQIVELPHGAFYEEGDKVKSIPFVQAVLHSIADYSLSPVNTCENTDAMLLKYAEYGAIPYYEWYYSDLGDEENTDEFYYMNSLFRAQSDYERMKKAFSDLRGERIVDHEEIKKGVFVTEYGSGARIYVNYNKKSVTVAGVTVDGKSFLRVG